MAQRVQAGWPLTLQVDGEMVNLESEEVLVYTEPIEGLTVVTDRGLTGLTVAVDPTLTLELVVEGQARELVCHIQQLCKDANLAICDRIPLYIIDTPLIQRVLERFSDYVMEETLTSKLVRVPSEKGVSRKLAQTPLRLGEEEVNIALERVQITKVMDYRPIEPLLPHRGSIRLPSFNCSGGWRITISPGWSPSITSASKLLR